MEINSDHTHKTNKPKPKKLLILSALASLLVVAVISIAVVQSRRNAHDHAAASAVVKSTCAATLYPELCVSTIRAAAPAASAIQSSKDVLITALNYTIYTVERNYFTVKKIGERRSKSLTAREKGALHDCLEVIDDTLEELKESEAELKDYGFKNYTLADHKENLMTLLSAAQTNQESCLDGFSHDNADKQVRKTLLAGQKHVFKLVSNVLAIVKNLSDTEMANNKFTPARKLGEDIAGAGGGGEWPEWMSAGG
ncbi:pectinesterase/pectinesterase inhibitor u1 [Phtheirospermum japonicum]|uniref:pectinesterase n=1 Tax=Phtheirospermum japonicum TaxID=374723 RepID=A0A830BAL9_9LAMI|nr:pectinesterase/pectinesterase inhibitor u1 [Phtheirospermum japonicum]